MDKLKTDWSVSMDTRKIAAEYRLSHWAEISREQTSSGLNVRKFCQQKQLRENVYYYWQKKLREATCGELVRLNDINNGILSQDCKNNTGVNKNEENRPSMGFVQLVADNKQNISSSITLDVQNCKIAVNNDTDLSLLAKVCSALRRI